MKNFAGIMVALFLTLVALSGWFFTLIVDVPMLLVLGYAITFFIFRVAVREWKWLGVYSVFLLPVNILALWIGGILPYFNLIAPEAVYFHIFPKEWLGVTGNDFMWNGFILPLTGGRIVPLEVIPTYHYLLFNVYAFLLWLSYPVALGYGAILGYAHSQVEAPWYQIFWPELFWMFIRAFVAFILIAGVAALLARIYC